MKLPDDPSPGTGRDVRQGRDLHLRRLELERTQRLADDPVLHLVDLVHVLQLRVLQEDAGHEGPHHRHAHAFVDGRGDEEASVLLVVGGQVRAPASKGDAERAAGDDHEKAEGRRQKAVSEF
ncbi:MAG: hypothetical protein R2712_18900 [Vicinamibacterales bacterium]